MGLDEYAQQPGHHQFIHHIDGRVIEIALSIPEKAKQKFFAIVGHPHPLQQGTMHNKVVTTAAKALFNQGIPVCRFNFRGVGQSAGVFDHGVGETDDYIALARAWKRIYPQAECLFLGFSFGAYVAYLAAQREQPKSLLLIAPPIFRFDFKFSPGPKRPDLILMGEQDEVVAPKDVLQFVQAFDPAVEIQWFAQTSHFFHGRLVELRTAVEQWAQQCLK